MSLKDRWKDRYITSRDPQLGVWILFQYADNMYQHAPVINIGNDYQTMYYVFRVYT